VTEPWISAGTIVQAVATLVLVGITAWYAKVTNGLLKEAQQTRNDELMPILWLRDVPLRPQQLFRIKRLNDSTARDVTIEGLKMLGPQVAYARGYLPFSLVTVSEDRDRVSHDMDVNAREAVTEQVPAELAGLLEQILGPSRSAVSGFIGVVRYSSLAGERFSSAAWWIQVQSTKLSSFDGADFLRHEVSLADVLRSWGPEIKRQIETLQAG